MEAFHFVTAWFDQLQFRATAKPELRDDDPLRNTSPAGKHPVNCSAFWPKAAPMSLSTRALLFAVRRTPNKVPFTLTVLKNRFISEPVRTTEFVSLRPPLSIATRAIFSASV